MVFSVAQMLKISMSKVGDGVYKLKINNADLEATNRNLINGGSTGSNILDFTTHLGMIYAVVPQQIQKFPPEVVPQPGDILGGAGALLADAFQVISYITCNIKIF